MARKIYGDLEIQTGGQLKVDSPETTFNSVTYTWPLLDGTTGQVLTTSGTGVLSWTTTSGGGGGGGDGAGSPRPVYPGDNISVLVNNAGYFDAHTDVDHNQTTNYVANRHVDHTSVSITTQHSLTGGGDISATRTLNLVNDTATPGNSKYYGTDGGGARGWFNLPSGGSGINAEEEGSLVSGGPFTTLNFIGSNVTATNGGSVTLDIQ